MLDGLSREHQTLMSLVMGTKRVLDRSLKEANRILLSSEKTCGPVADGLRAMESCHGEIGRISDVVRSLIGHAAMLKDECQAYTLGVQSGAEMIVAMLYEEANAFRMRAGPGSSEETARMMRSLGHWLDMFADRVAKEKGLHCKDKENKGG